jgi:hypothetical protein
MANGAQASDRPPLANGFLRMAYGQKPDDYKTAWRSVAAAARANPDANSTYMLWAPNIASGSVDSIGGYTQYYPGNDTVDIAGLSWYFTGDQDSNTLPSENLFIRGMQPFYSLYGDIHPIVITETSAPYHYVLPSAYSNVQPDSEISDIPNLSTLTTVPASGSQSELSMKSQWLQQMTGERTAGRFPHLTAVSMFNYFKRSWEDQLVDYRYIGGKSEVEAWMRSYVGNVTAYQGGFDGAASRLRLSPLAVVVAALIAWTIMF